MLVRFKSDVGGFTMFGDVAKTLLRLAGHSASVPGAIPAEDVAEALARLEAAMAAREASGEDAGAAGERDDGDAEPPVALRQRAFPLIELLRDAAREPCGIMWDQD